MSQKEITEKLAELVEQCGHSAKLFIKAEMCLKNGDLQGTQKYTKQAAQLVSVMKKDVFLEIAEVFEIEMDESAEIEDINTLELANHMCEITYNSGVLLNLMQDNIADKICSQVKTKILQHINSATKLYDAIFEN